jgi:cell wall-associated NlpC family hydrolase
VKKLALFVLPVITALAPLLVVLVIMQSLFSGLGVAGYQASKKQNSSEPGCAVATDLKPVDKNFNAAAFHNEWKKMAGGVLADQEQYTIEAAKKAGVSAYLFAAIMANESGWGKSRAARVQHNPSGQMNSDVIINYPSIEAGIDATGRTLNNLVVNRKLNTIEKLGAVYCPVGASNDPTGMNSSWIPTVKGMVQGFMGNTNYGLIQLGVAGGGCSSANVTISGDKVSYFDQIWKYAKAQLGKPYIFGAASVGDNPKGFDCSSYTQWVLAKSGIKLPRTAQTQWDATKRIDANDVKAGDLVFFHGTYNAGTYITHVGMMLNKTKMINASGKEVKYTEITNSYWSAHLAGFGRVK